MKSIKNAVAALLAALSIVNLYACSTLTTQKKPSTSGNGTQNEIIPDDPTGEESENGASTTPTTPKEDEDTPIFSDELKGLDIRDCWDFHDGLATIRYLKGGTSHYSLINVKGEILATNTEHQTNFTTIGKGYAFHKVNDSFILLDDKGETISEFDEFNAVLCGGDGLALVDNVVESISGTQHFLGVVNHEGNWVQPLTEIEAPVQPYNGHAYYAENGIFLLSLESANGYYYLQWNIKTNRLLYLNNIDWINNERNIAKGFVVFQANSDSTVSESYNATDGTPLQADCIYSLSPDGVYQKEATEEELLTTYYNGYGDGKIVLNKETHIEIVDVSTQKTVIYDDYGVSSVANLLFYDDYGVVQLKRTDGTTFFTVVNEDGEELFTPILYDDFNGMSNPCYSEGFVIYPTKERKFSICDLEGNVTPVTAEHYQRSSVFCDGRFHNGYAVFEYLKDSWSPTKDFYINTKGERVLF